MSYHFFGYNICPTDLTNLKHYKKACNLYNTEHLLQDFYILDKTAVSLDSSESNYQTTRRHMLDYCKLNTECYVNLQNGRNMFLQIAGTYIWYCIAPYYILQKTVIWIFHFVTNADEPYFEMYVRTSDVTPVEVEAADVTCNKYMWNDKEHKNWTVYSTQLLFLHHRSCFTADWIHYTSHNVPLPIVNIDKLFLAQITANLFDSVSTCHYLSPLTRWEGQKEVVSYEVNGNRSSKLASTFIKHNV
jgi:hypothetical protein